ncbi:CubicO group peptidase (beta-lactamase class C family) [Kribbella voronezhensis]|uniref:CubicO group peptidase (Beta-lactamase class C family) n=1 Tax=Kribbella voronezhensis TaxID=2512212 RepID=A0A4R7SSX8_9ACTN|nr:serine hydrolase domain-containing protein [Kribbella voronezhensis]TDU82370.1 CubicO group peptidase (beta-lactamase class C family) [Kribbella voronezhensis]
MATLSEIEKWLQDRLPALLAEHEVPGTAVAVLFGGEVIDHAAGVLSKATGVETTADTVFQIGSITKVWTTTLVMQLVDEGKVDLDEPVRDYLPEFVLKDDEAAAAITVRQLLSHQAGFEGDIFNETGKGDDAVEKFMPTLAEVGQLFAPGEMFSYNNAGFVVLGRLIEVLRGKPYDAVLREHLFTPLGLTHAATDPYEAILHRAAVGHLRPAPDEAPVPAPIWAMTRGMAPAGAMLAMRPRDLLTFATLHLAEGKAADGTAVLSAASVKAMQEPQVKVPALGLMGDSWGLGWEIFDWGGTRVIGHDGGTIGQNAFLRIVPEHGLAVTVLTNGGDTIELYKAVVGQVVKELAGLELPALPTPPDTAVPIDTERMLGTYSCEVADFTIRQDDDGKVWLDQTPKGIFAELGPAPEPVELVGRNEESLIAVKAENGVHLPQVFLGDDGSGHALYLHNGRAIRRATT